MFVSLVVCLDVFLPIVSITVVRKRNRSRAIGAVLEEQAMQWDYDGDDSEAMAFVYSDYSQPVPS